MVGYWLLHFAEVHSSSGTGTKLTVHCTMVWTSSKKLPKMDTAPHLRGGRFREGEVLDLSENARKESERKFAPEVEHMFDAVMSDDFDASHAASLS